MTNAIEKIIVTITLHRDSDPRFPYDNLKETLNKVWPHICPWAPVSNGHLKVAGLEIQWESTGLYEEAEVIGSDN